jgi:hypothetical protein
MQKDHKYDEQNCSQNLASFQMSIIINHDNGEAEKIGQYQQFLQWHQLMELNSLLEKGNFIFNKRNSHIFAWVHLQMNPYLNIKN